MARLTGEELAELREAMVSVYEARLDPALVVELDTSGWGGRIRVILNDGPVYDGDPETEEPPGSGWDLDWTLVHVPETVALEVLAYFESPHGTGHFNSLLIRTILSADDANTLRLGYGFREWVRAVHLWKSDKDELRRLAGRF